MCLTLCDPMNCSTPSYMIASRSNGLLFPVLRACITVFHSVLLGHVLWYFILYNFSELLLLLISLASLQLLMNTRKKSMFQSYNKRLKKATKGFNQLPHLCISVKDYGVFRIVNSPCKYPSNTKQKKKYLAFSVIFSACSQYVIAFQLLREFSGSQRLIQPSVLAA